MPVRAYLSLSLTMAEQMPSMCCPCLSGTPCLAHAACMSNCLPRAFSGPGSSEQASEDGSQGPGGSHVSIQSRTGSGIQVLRSPSLSGDPWEGVLPGLAGVSSRSEPQLLTGWSALDPACADVLPHLLLLRSPVGASFPAF